MADVSQIQLESVIYDIKDAAARNELATLENEIIISDTQPTAQNNKLWVKESSSSDGVSIPTMTDIGTIQNTLNNLDSDDIANASTNVSGATVTAAIDTLKTSLATVPDFLPKQQIPQNSDFNTYTTAGTYYVSNDSEATTMSNIPRLASGTLIVVARSQSTYYIVQFYIPTTGSNKIYTRIYGNGIWGVWSEFIGQETETVAHNGSSGTIYLKKSGNVRIINFDDVKASRSGITFANDLPDYDKPVHIATGVMFVNTGKVACVWINSSGKLLSSGVTTNDVLNGSFSWTVN